MGRNMKIKADMQLSTLRNHGAMKTQIIAFFNAIN